MRVVRSPLSVGGRGAIRSVAVILVAGMGLLGLHLPAQAASGTGTITGTVTDTVGAPVGGVTVTVLPPDESTRRQALTAADGTYTIADLEPAPYTVSFDPPSEANLLPEYWDNVEAKWAASSVDVTAGGTASGIDAQLAARPRITGTVTGPDGGPVRGVRVDVLTSDGSVGGSADTAGDGTYTVVGLYPGLYAVSFDPPSDVNLLSEYWDDAVYQSEATPVVVGAGETASAVDAQLAAGGTITGTVTGPGGAPVVDASVSVSSSYWGTRSSTTSADGTYEVFGLRESRYEVEFTAPSALNLLPEYWNDVEREHSATGVTVGAGATVPGIDAELSPGGTIEGIVTGPDGAPVADVDVYASGSSSSTDLHATTAADGTYTITGARSGRYEVRFVPPAGAGLVTEYWADGTSTSTATVVVVGAGATVSGIDAQLSAPGTISGKVTGPDGAPVGDAVVCATTASLSDVSVLTAADGTYSIAGLPWGVYTVSFSPPSGENLLSEYWDDEVQSSQATPVVVTGGATTAGIDAQLSAAATIAGKVTGPDGAALGGVDVRALSANPYEELSTRTAPDGTYEIGGLRPGAYKVMFSAWAPLLAEYWDDAETEATATPVVVAWGETVSGIDARLALGGAIEGRVSVPGGFLARNVGVVATNIADGRLFYADIEQDGSYRIDDLYPGSYAIKFAPPSGVNLVTEFWNDVVTVDEAAPVVVGAGVTVSGIDVTLVVGGQITGKVTGPDGAPLAVRVSAADVNGEDYAYTWSRADGTYTINGLHAGPNVVQFSYRYVYAPEFWNDAPSRATATPVMVSLGATTAGIDARLELGATLSGTVKDQSGAGVGPGISVEVLDGSGVVVPKGTTVTAADGTYSLPALREGSVKVVFARARAVTPYAAQYFDGASTLAAASTVTLTVGSETSGIDAVLATGASITGRVAAADGSPRARLEVVAFTADNSLPSRGGRTDADGNYTIEGLLPGEYIVAAVRSAPAGRDTYYGAGEVLPSAPNVTVVGTATTSGINITTTCFPMAVTPTPAISGSRSVGSTLAAVPGAWSPERVSLTYQWKRAGAAISGATAKTYKLVAADAGKAVTVTVTGSKTGYTSVAKTSAAVTIEKLLTATPTPKITGTRRVGYTLTAVPGTWSPATVTLKYQWKRAGVAISGATARTYKLVKADAGKTITVTVTGSKTGYTSVAKTSAAVSIEKLLTATPVPTITGTRRVGYTLTANAGTWKPAPVTLKYQWKRAGVAISGATARTYKVTKTDVGKAITVTVTGSKTGYTPVAKTSAAVKPTY